MTDSSSPIIDTKVLAQQYKNQSIPYECPVCHKVYKSLAGVLYHIGQFRGVTKLPRCMTGDDTPARGSPGLAPSSPMTSSRKKTPKREALTWAESQRFIEFELDYEYHRLEIDSELNMESTVDDTNDIKSESAEIKSTQTPKRRSKLNAATAPTSSTATPQKGTRNKGKRRSKLKTPSQDNSQIKLPEVSVQILDCVECPDAPSRDSVYYRFIEQSAEEMDEMVEYDMDEEDHQWLGLINEERKNEGLTAVPQEAFELLMDRLEKECVFESHVTGLGGESINPYNIDENAVCCICNDGECHNTNAILFCDMCNLAVHQECYGVPYIPEGQWLCRRCLQSPSRSVDCVLCPNKGGAFKQTTDGRWAHVICSLWIPEVQFANPVFLEPIDGINDVPSARWKLLCYICRKRAGACIQCAKANCYVAFHVTCAQQANLCMKIEMGKNGVICNSAFCDSHTPLSARKKLMESLKNIESGEESEGKENEDSVQTPRTGSTSDCGGGTMGTDLATEREGEDLPPERKKGKSESKVVKRARKILEEQRVLQAPVVNLPYIPQHRLDRIISRVSLHKKAQFIPKLVSYWKLKRQSRNGVPFLRRLQASNKGQKTTVAMNLSVEEREALMEQLTLWKALRQDLERARMLVELVRKREKLKREQLRMSEETFRLRLSPLEMIMKRLLMRLAAKDPADIFAEPVPLEDVPDYLDIINEPMDLGTMKTKLESHQYTSLEQFEKDLQLVWHNAMIYNQKDTIYYRAAVRIRDASKRILEQAYKQVDSAGINCDTGMHDPDVEEPPPLTPNTAAVIQRLPLDMYTKEGEYASELGNNNSTIQQPRERLSSTTLDEQVEYLEEQLSVLSQCKKSARKSKEKQLRKELNSLKRQIKIRDKANDPDATSPPRRKPAPPHQPQDAEGLASQLLHGSLRMTVSRRAILSSSGIKFDERVKTKQKQIEEEEMNKKAEKEEEEEEVEEEVEEEMEEEVEEEVEEEIEEEVEEQSEMEQEEEEEEEEEEKQVIKSPSKTINTRKRHSTNNRRGTRVTWKDRAVISKPHPPQPTTRRRVKRRKRSYPMACERRKQRSSHDRKPSRQKLLSETSNSEGEINTGIGEGGVQTRSRNNCSSSSLGGDEIIEEESRLFRSPSSDVIVTEGRFPSASSNEDLTVSTLTTRKRRNSAGASDSDNNNKRRRRSSSHNQQQHVTVAVTAGKNGLSNGVQRIPQPLELVWAKCRGYPSYPALVIDPAMPSEGLRVNGEFIQAPSEEVLDHKDKNPQNTILVRFFDGRRSWQWLHPTKLDSLGINKDFDHTLVGSSGASKRSVQQAYDRAMRYHRKVLQTNPEDPDTDCSSST